MELELNTTLLLLFLPLHVFLAPLILAYEVVAAYFDDHVANPHSNMREYPNLAWCILVMLPLNIFHHISLDLRPPLHSIQARLWTVFSTLLWLPLREAIHRGFRHVNSKLYDEVSLPGAEFIRVVEVAPGVLSDPLRIHVKRISLRDEEEGPFEALSYSWGHSSILRRLIRANGAPFLVTDSAYRALVGLRYPDKTRTIWVDSICINQHVNVEKNEQVALMHDIYSRACSVVVWLGSAPKQIDETFSNMLGNEFTYGTAIAHSGPLQTLLRRRWWGRVWVVQEVAVARHVVFRAGHVEISWADMLALLQRVQDVYGTKVANSDTRVLNFLRTVGDLQTGEHNYGPIDLALRFRQRMATDPRDKIFGVRALSRIPLAPNYSLSTWETYALGAGVQLMHSQSLAPIVHAEGRPMAGCSWATNWQDWTDWNWPYADPFQSQVMKDPKHVATPFWGDGQIPSIYELYGGWRAAGSLSDPCLKGKTAGGDLLARIGWPQNAIHWNEKNPQSWRLLNLTGWEVDTIYEVGIANIPRSEDPPAFLANIRKWDALARSSWEGDPDVYQTKFNHCIFAGGLEDWDWSGVDFKSVSEVLESFKQSVAAKRPFGNTAFPFDPTVSPKSRFQFFTLLVACCWGRRFFTTVSGRFGLGPETCRSGDNVCVVAGSPVPIMLGRRDKSHLNCREYIGQAFLEGEMCYRGDIETDIGTRIVGLEQFGVC